MPRPRPFAPSCGWLLAALVPLAVLAAGLYPSLAAHRAPGTVAASDADVLEAAGHALRDAEVPIARLREVLASEAHCDALIRGAVDARTRLNAALWAVADATIEPCAQQHGREATRRLWEGIIERTSC